MRENNFDLDSGTYIHICETSPQINRIQYNKDNNIFGMETNDNAKWEFHVHPA